MNNTYKEEIFKSIETISSQDEIQKTSTFMEKAFIDNKKIYTFGTGHSHMFGEELYARAGGWTYIVPILEDELTLSSSAFKSTFIERVEGFSSVLFSLYPISKGDMIIIVSNSGRNGLIVEMAIKAKQAGATVVAVTSIKHSNFVSSRHSSGKLLKDVADVVIDNGAPVGDATIEVKKGKVSPISTITNTYIAHMLVTQTLQSLDEKNIDYDVLVSSNLDNQDERNKKLMGNK